MSHSVFLGTNLFFPRFVIIFSHAHDKMEFAKNLGGKILKLSHQQDGLGIPSHVSCLVQDNDNISKLCLDYPTCHDQVLIPDCVIIYAT